jgi:hypothetical protein
VLFTSVFAGVKVGTLLLPYQAPVRAYNDDHQMHLNGLNRIRSNLQALLESEIWR